MQPVRYMGMIGSRKRSWVNRDVLELCDERRDLKKKRYEAGGARRKQKEDRIGTQCEEIEVGLNKNNIKRAYQL